MHTKATERLAAAAVAARAEEAVKVYGNEQTAVRALDGVALDLAAGKFTAIMGPSGSGKSTLLHCLAALDGLTSGRVFLGGTDLGTLDDQRLTLLRRERIGFIFQSLNLLPALSALDNITLPQRIAARLRIRPGSTICVAWSGCAGGWGISRPSCPAANGSG